MPRDVVFTIPDGAVEGAPLIVEAGNAACGAGKSIHQQNHKARQIQTNTELNGSSSCNVVFFLCMFSLCNFHRHLPHLYHQVETGIVVPTTVPQGQDSKRLHATSLSSILAHRCIPWRFGLSPALGAVVGRCGLGVVVSSCTSSKTARKSSKNPKDRGEL